MGIPVGHGAADSAFELGDGLFAADLAEVVVDAETEQVFVVIDQLLKVDADEFGNKIEELMEQQDSDVLVNLSGMEYINSEGLGRLIELHKSARQKRVVLISPTPLVAQVLLVTKLDTYIPVVDSVDDAITALSEN
ncbi:MAG: STAS domain-containing protein [Planctomycetes bacterium]|nr:STAS domain-containing protein [Planctomycetota bacterium]